MLVTSLVVTWMLASPAQPPRLADADSTYTSVKWSDCRLLDRSDQGGHSERMCPGVAGYTVRIHDSDHGGSLDLLRGERVVLRGPTTHWWDVTDKIVEWRFRRGDPKRPFAFMFRMHCGGAPETCPSRMGKLQVVRLDGERACIIGTTPSNAEAHRIADDMKRPCVDDWGR